MVRRPWLVVFLLLTAACGASEAAGPDSGAPSTPVPTIGGVGVLPDTIARESEPPVIIQPPVNEDGTAAELVGQQIAGNRLIMIGDSILAATDRRFGGEMCAALVPLGWQVEIDAEPGRFVEFGTKVLDRRLDPDGGEDLNWDAAAVFLGSNYRGDQAAYEAELLEIIGRLAPRPILLFTVTEYKPAWAQVNEVVERIAAEFEFVSLVDWKTISQAPGVLSSDRLHPTEAGELILVDLTAAQIGRAPVGQGECLRSQFTDSSAVTGTSSSGVGSGAAGSTTGGGQTGGTSSSGSGGGSSSSGSSGSGSGGSSGSGGGSTVPATTSSPGTTPAGTTPPGTSPPGTSPPGTSPAGTTAPPPTAPPAPPPTAPPAPPPTAPPAPPPTAPPAPTDPPAPPPTDPP